MVDSNILIAKYLRSLNLTCPLLPSGLPARGTTGSIYAVNLPSDLVIGAGPVIVVAGRGGRNNPEIQGIINPRIQIMVYDDIGQQLRARQVYAALFDKLDGAGNVTIAGVGTIMSCFETVAPQDLTDPETDWATVVSFYELFARS